MLLFCGPKLSICIVIFSIWGAVQLGLMGIFFYVNCVCLYEDLPLDKLEELEPKEFLDKIEAVFFQSAINCWITSAIYLVTMLIALYQFRLNRRFEELKAKKNNTSMFQG